MTATFKVADVISSISLNSLGGNSILKKYKNQKQFFISIQRERKSLI